MDYIGEHLLPGKIGHLFIILSFIASIIANDLSYLVKTRIDLSISDPAGTGT